MFREIFYVVFEFVFISWKRLENNDVFSRIRVLLDDSLKLDLVRGILLRFKH